MCVVIVTWDKGLIVCTVYIYTYKLPISNINRRATGSFGKGCNKRYTPQGRNKDYRTFARLNRRVYITHPGKREVTIFMYIYIYIYQLLLILFDTVVFHVEGNIVKKK